MDALNWLWQFPLTRKATLLAAYAAGFWVAQAWAEPSLLHLIGVYLCAVLVLAATGAVWFLQADNAVSAAARRRLRKKFRLIDWFRGVRQRSLRALQDEGSRLAEFHSDMAATTVAPGERLAPGRIPVGSVMLRPNRAAPKSLAQQAVEPERNVLICAGARSGKTITVLIPALLSSGLTGTATIVTDPKGEILKKTMAYRSQVGTVTVWDPSNFLDGAVPTMKWNLLQYIRRSPTPAKMYDRSLEQARALASDARLGGATNMDFFTKLASNLLAPMLLAAAFDTSKGIDDLIRWVTGGGTNEDDYNEICAILDRYVAEGGHAQILVDQGVQTSWDDKMRSNAFTTALTILEVLKGTDVAESSDLSTGTVFDAREFLTRPGTHYLVASEDKMEELAGLFMAHLNEILREARALAHEQPDGKLPIPLVNVLEETANVACLAGLPKYLSFDAGRRITYVTVFQTLSQILDIWGRTQFDAVMTNSHAKLFLSGEQCSETKAYLESRGGNRHVTETSTTTGGDGKQSSKSTSTREKALVSADELAQMKFGEGVLFYPRSPVATVTTKPFTEQPDMMRRIEYANEAWAEDVNAGRVNPPDAPVEWARPVAHGDAPWLAAAQVAGPDPTQAPIAKVATARATATASRTRIAERDALVAPDVPPPPAEPTAPPYADEDAPPPHEDLFSDQYAPEPAPVVHPNVDPVTGEILD